MCVIILFVFFFFSSRRRHTRCLSDWSSDVCSSDLEALGNQESGVRSQESVKQALGRAQAYLLRCQQADGGFAFTGRSEERRVGKECRSRWSGYGERKKVKKYET